jgi:hypothetical protein
VGHLSDALVTYARADARGTPSAALRRGGRRPRNRRQELSRAPTRSGRCRRPDGARGAALPGGLGHRVRRRAASVDGGRSRCHGAHEDGEFGRRSRARAPQRRAGRSSSGRAGREESGRRRCRRRRRPRSAARDRPRARRADRRGSRGARAVRFARRVAAGSGHRTGARGATATACHVFPPPSSSPDGGSRSETRASSLTPSRPAGHLHRIPHPGSPIGRSGARRVPSAPALDQHPWHLQRTRAANGWETSS